MAMTDSPAKSGKSGALFFSLTALLVVVCVWVLVSAVRKNSDLERKLAVSHSETNTLQATLARIQNNDMKVLSTDLQDYKSKYERTAAENDRLTQADASSRKANAELENQMREKDKLVEIMRKEGKEAHTAVQKLGLAQGENNRLKGKTAGLEKEINELRPQNGSLKKKITQLENNSAARELKKLKSENEALKKKLVSEQKKFNEFQKQAGNSQKGILSNSGKTLQEAETKIKTMTMETAIMHYNLGVIYMHQGSYGQAAEEFTHALRWNPNDASAHYNLAVIYNFYLAKPKEAIPHYEAYIRLFPKAPDVNDVRYQLFQLRLNEESGSGEDLFVAKKK